MKSKWIIVLALCLCLSGCQLSPRLPEGSPSVEEAQPDAPAAEAPAPEETTSQETDPEPEADPLPQADEALCRQILLDYGANQPQDPVQEGWLHADKGVSLYYRGAWGPDDPLSPGDYFTWRLHYLNLEGLSYEEQVSRYSFPDGRENAGWFFPQEDYEALLSSRFDVTAQDLRDDDFYDEQLQGYRMPGPPGIGMTPFVVYDHHEQSPQEDGSSLLSIHYTLVSPIQAEPNGYYILSVLLAPDGSFRYQSCQEDPSPSDEQQQLAVPAAENE